MHRRHDLTAFSLFSGINPVLAHSFRATPPSVAFTISTRHLGRMPHLSVQTPVGPLTLTETNGALTAVTWSGSSHDETPLLKEAERQVTAYFAGGLQLFDLPLKVEGSDVQRDVCDAMRAIPFGETRTYGDLAKDLGVPAQAIGQACGGNPIPVIIPCHRVLGASSLGGFSGGIGIETKIALLKHEGAASLLL